jgi:hypothetical protein
MSAAKTPLMTEIDGSYHEHFRNLPICQEFIQRIVAQFHYRNGVTQKDGSMGEIHVTTKEFRDALAYAIENA